MRKSLEEDSDGALSIEHSGGIATVMLDRPQVHNAVTLDMWRGLAKVFAALGEDRDTRCIVLTGAGGSFSAGADVTEFGAVRSTPEQVDAYQVAVDTCIDAISDVPKPTVAVVRGYCLGGGCGLAMACDFRLADRSAKFGIPAARLSIVYGSRETQNLLTLVGLAQAKRILFLGRRMDADAAHRIGLVDEVVDDVDAAAAEWTSALAANAPLSIAGAKYLLDGFAKGEGRLDRARADRIVREASLSDDYAEGRRAFAEKREPVFKGA